MQVWNEIVAAGLVGTEKQPFSPGTLPGKSDEALREIQSGSSEENLLAAAGLVGLYGRAGQALTEFERKPHPLAEKEELPECSPAAARRLLTILKGGDSALEGARASLLKEWLQVVSRVGKRVPARAVPAILDAGARSAELRDLILSVAGRRGI